MSIAFKRYVNIISGVGGGNNVRQRDLILRIITSSLLVSPLAVLEFTSADDVATYFGTASEEYRRAVDYFGYVSPNIVAPQKISYARWSEAGNGAAVIGNNDAKVLANLTVVNAGAFDIVLNGVTSHVTAIDLSAAGSMAAIATAIQARVIAAGHAAATVTYAGAAGANRFTVQLGPTELGTVVINPVSVGAQDVATKLGLTAATNAIDIGGVNPQAPADALIATNGISDNFGSFLFTDVLTIDEVEAVAGQNDTYNVKFMYLQRVLAADAAAWSTALIGFSGVGLTLMDPATYPNEYPDQFPGAILAATDYTQINGVTNYMFRQGQNLTPLVVTDAAADTYDAERVNYYGQTSTAGQQIAFYQRGKLMGLATDPVDMNVYANEEWLKDYAGSLIMGLLLSVSRVPANLVGVGMVLGQVQVAVDAALANGTISVGKTLTNTQKVFISQQSGNPLAWRDVESVGYILSCVIVPVVQTDGSTEYEAQYKLIYSKDDAIRRVDGTHVLI